MIDFLSQLRIKEMYYLTLHFINIEIAILYILSLHSSIRTDGAPPVVAHADVTLPAKLCSA